MACHHKYNRSEGCSICATKNSTSQFRPWYDHYPEECYCRVFRLDNLDGRRGYVCNPCVLYIKRAIQSLDNPSKEQLQNPPDHTKRLDFKQAKGIPRPVVADVWPPDGVGSTHETMPLKDRGFHSRQMTFRPRYAFTGRPFVKLLSTYQLIPAGRWRDPRDFLEPEDNAEKDLKYYRRVTLRKGAKTLKEKEEENRRAEALENAKLFGKVTDKSLQLGRNFITNKKEHKQNTRYSTRSKGRKSIPHAANQSERKRAAQTGLCGARAKGKHAAVEECFVDGKEDLWKDVQYFSTQVEESDDEGTDKEKDDLAFGEAEKSVSVSIDDIDESSSSSFAAEVRYSTEDVPVKVAFNVKAEASVKKWRSGWTEDTETIQRKCHCPVQNNNNAGSDHERMEEEGKDHHSDSQEPKLCSLQAKKKNRRTIQEPVKNLKPRNVSFMDCSYWQKFRLCCVDLYMGEGRNAVIRPRAKKWRCPVMLKHMERLRQRKRRPQTRVAHAAEEEEAALKVVEETEVAAKETEASLSLSSGEEELNDDRNNFTSSPLVGISLAVEDFHFFGAQHSKESEAICESS